MHRWFYNIARALPRTARRSEPRRSTNTSMTKAMVEGGYDYNFVKPIPDRLLCNVCQLPCREPQQTRECGHLFYKSCIKKWMSFTTGSHDCPVCRKKPFTMFPQLKDDRKIKALKIYCPNKSDGCSVSDL